MLAAVVSEGLGHPSSKLAFEATEIALDEVNANQLSLRSVTE